MTGAVLRRPAMYYDACVYCTGGVTSHPTCFVCGRVRCHVQAQTGVEPAEVWMVAARAGNPIWMCTDVRDEDHQTARADIDALMLLDSKVR